MLGIKRKPSYAKLLLENYNTKNQVMVNLKTTK